MSSFVLVHGAWHGGWCWDALVPHLTEQGHQAMAVELPCEDRAANFDDYAAVVIDAVRSCTEPVTIVGHSMGAIATTIAALKQPVDTVVYLCGVLPPVQDMPHDDEPRQFPDGAYDPLVRHPDGSHSWPDAASAIHAMYHDCTPDAGEDAFTHLRRQQTRLWDDLTPLPHWPRAKLRSFVAKADRLVTPDWSRWVSRHWLGIEPEEIDGSHSPMLSRPEELARLLVD